MTIDEIRSILMQFVDKYSILRFGNGGDLVRRGSSLDKKYIIELTKDGIKISGVKLCGFKGQVAN